ncbi:uncharacterized protein LOC143614144 [Bidens hawaiensis]|uniref:uncharacterized protein LOC143614144 n=1 Tax=Bidens hawaiensis TaxID=980011 RepID=UPI00404A120B
MSGPILPNDQKSPTTLVVIIIIIIIQLLGFEPVILKPCSSHDGLLQDRLNILKTTQLTDDIKEEEEGDNRTLDRTGNDDMDSSGGLVSGTPDKIKRFKTRMKPKIWTAKEEEALATAWIDITKDSEPANSFWKRVLAHFEEQSGSTERNVHQLNSKWKEMNLKITRFNDIYNDKVTNRQTGQSDADLLNATNIDYKKLYAPKGFFHETTWDIVKNNPTWIAVSSVPVTPAQVTHQPLKRTKTSDSNTCTKSSKADFPIKLDDEDEGVPDEEPEPPTPQQKRKKSVSSSSSTEQQELLKIVSEFISFNKEDIENRKHVRAEKLRLMKEKHESKMLLYQAEMRMLEEQQKDKDMDFILKPHDHLDGVMLKAVLARKREIAQRWGWE